MLPSRSSRMLIGLAAVALLAAACIPPEVPSTSYDDLVTLFEEWRAFEQPDFVDGVPDYSTQVMAKQHRELAMYQRRLAAIDPTGWPVAHQVDHHLVRAEMNGLDFDHRIRRPWARNPAFYTMIFAGCAPSGLRAPAVGNTRVTFGHLKLHGGRLKPEPLDGASQKKVTGAIGAQITIPPFLVISDATNPIRRMLRSRCSFEKPSSEERCFRTISPSSRATGRPRISRNLTRSTFAIVDFPAQS